MRKAMILTMSLAIVMALVSGCATAAKGPSDEELIKGVLANWKAGMEGKDIAKIESGISSEFKHYEWDDKAGLIGFLKQTFNQGDLDNAKVNIDNAKIDIEKGTATVYPVEMSAAFGSATIEFSMKKEADGQWRAVGITVEGV